MKSPKAEAEPNGALPAAAAPTLGGANGLLPGGAENVSVDKIRDLLFGNQMQDYDRRFSNMEDRFTQKLRDLEAETQRGLSAFESNSKKQIESVAGQLREEKDLRADADKEIERSLREQIQSLEKRVRQLSDQVGQLEGGLARFGKTYADEPERLVAALAEDEAIAAADTLLLTVPNQLGVDYNAHLIESVLTHVAPELGWR